MTDEQYAGLHKILSELLESVQMLIRVTKQSQHRPASDGRSDKAPGYVKPLADYATFDWKAIDATVVDSDKDGAATVEWKGRMFTRRRGNPDFEPVVYFSRFTGVTDATTGKREYEWLITFREPAKPKRLPEETREAIENAVEKKTAKTPPPAQQPPPPPDPKREYACRPETWAALLEVVDKAAKVGVKPENWKPRVLKIVGSDNLREMDSADVAKAMNVIKGLTQTAQLLPANRE